MVESAGTGTMLDGNTSALDQHMRDTDRAEERRERLEARFPLEDFEELAWLHFYDPNFDAVNQIVDDGYEDAAFAIVKSCGLVHGYNTTNDMQINKYLLNIEARIERWIDAEQIRLRAEAMRTI